jgi:hypothetical protein
MSVSLSHMEILSQTRVRRPDLGAISIASVTNEILFFGYVLSFS